MKRPTSVTIIAWILIVLSGLSLVTSTLTLNNPVAQDLMAQSPLPLSVQYAMLYVGLALSIVCGIAMLKGQNWARFLYVVWTAISLVIGFATSPMKAAMLPGLVVFVIVIVFLFLPKANAYFSAAGAASDAQGVEHHT